MKMNIKTIAAALALALAIPSAATAQDAGKGNKKVKKVKWTGMAQKLDDGFFTSAEAARIGDNLLFYQHASGGWPKNMQLQDGLTDGRRKEVEEMKQGKRYATIDNKATTTEITYLARLYNATNVEKYKEAALRGLDYLFEAQYDNGGWPQFYPLSKGYYTHITYNDDGEGQGQGFARQGRGLHTEDAGGAGRTAYGVVRTARREHPAAGRRPRLRAGVAQRAGV